MGPWDRWDLGLKDPGPQGPPIIKLHIDYIMKLFIDTRPGPARPGPARPARPARPVRPAPLHCRGQATCWRVRKNARVRHMATLGPGARGPGLSSLAIPVPLFRKPFQAIWYDIYPRSLANICNALSWPRPLRLERVGRARGTLQKTTQRRKTYPSHGPPAANPAPLWPRAQGLGPGREVDVVQIGALGPLAAVALPTAVLIVAALYLMSCARLPLRRALARLGARAPRRREPLSRNCLSLFGLPCVSVLFAPRSARTLACFALWPAHEVGHPCSGAGIVESGGVAAKV